MLLDEPWASEDKENKKPSEPSEEDTCLIEDLPVVCNEVRVQCSYTFSSPEPKKCQY